MNLVAYFHRLAITLAFALGLSILSISNLQAAECKGLSKTKCEAANCTWVKSYKTKTGSTVNAYCRNKPSKSAKKKADSAKKGTTSKAKTSDKKTKSTKSDKAKKSTKTKTKKKETKKSAK